MVLAFDIIVQPSVIRSIFVIFHYFSIFLKQHYVFSTPDYYKSQPIFWSTTHTWYTMCIYSYIFNFTKKFIFLWKTPLHTIYCWAAHFWVNFFSSNFNWKFGLQHAELSSFFFQPYFHDVLTRYTKVEVMVGIKST